METPEFNKALDDNAALIEKIRILAHEIHASVNQHYDKRLPYSFHLDMVAENVRRHGAEVCACADDVVPMMFGAYFHDSIEDARLTYNDVMRIASQIMPQEKVLMATEIVYALTNEKGRTRAERADDRYYSGIRVTPYAPMAKFADRLANMSYSQSHSSSGNTTMRDVYEKEIDHFKHELLSADYASDPRLKVPDSMLSALEKIMQSAQK